MKVLVIWLSSASHFSARLHGIMNSFLKCNRTRQKVASAHEWYLIFPPFQISLINLIKVWEKEIYELCIFSLTVTCKLDSAISPKTENCHLSNIIMQVVGFISTQIKLTETAWLYKMFFLNLFCKSSIFEKYHLDKSIH